MISHVSTVEGISDCMEIEFNCPHCDALIEGSSDLSGSTATCPACRGGVLVPAPGVEVGMEIGGYRIDRKVGAGGMGQVYEATQLAMDRKVALKILSPALLNNQNTVDRFLHEAKMAAKLDHRNIVTAFDTGCDSGYYYLAMTLVNGVDYETRLKVDRRIDEKEVLKVAFDVSGALRYAWDCFKLLHRDLKPANLILDDDGEVMLMDMGLAKMKEEDSSLTAKGVSLGTPHYISPEQALGHEMDCRSDIYSLGSTLFHMITGRRPFSGPTPIDVIANHVKQPPTPPVQLNQSVSPACNQLILRMMAKKPEDRYQDWRELRLDVANQLGIDPDLPTATFPAQHPKRRKRPMRPRSRAGIPPQRPPRKMSAVAKSIAVLSCILLLLLGFLGWIIGKERQAIQRAATPPTAPVQSGSAPRRDKPHKGKLKKYHLRKIP